MDNLLSFDSLPVPLLHARLGDLKAAVYGAKPSKCCFGQIRSIVVVGYLQPKEEDTPSAKARTI